MEKIVTLQKQKKNWNYGNPTCKIRSAIQCYIWQEKEIWWWTALSVHTPQKQLIAIKS